MIRPLDPLRVETMTKGATAVIVFSGRRVQDLLAAYERALVDSDFDIRRRDWTGQAYVHKAVLGSKAKAYFVRRLVPLGSLTKSGNRLGAEAQIYAYGDQAIIRVAIVPYMELFDKAEIAFVTQGVFEKLVEDDWSRDKLNEILGRMAALGFGVPVPLKA